MGCALNNQETGKPVIKLRLEPKKRRKRDADKEDDRSVEKSDKTKITKSPVYGCPEKYERVTSEGIDLCFRFGEDKKTNKDLIIEFDKAKAL